jgi:hypothetical protein
MYSTRCTVQDVLFILFSGVSKKKGSTVAKFKSQKLKDKQHANKTVFKFVKLID